jgi:hypothetical protein
MLRSATANQAGRIPAWLRLLHLKSAQRSAEGLHRRMRRNLLKMDEHLEATLAFSGRSE